VAISGYSTLVKHNTYEIRATTPTNSPYYVASGVNLNMVEVVNVQKIKNMMATPML
jgi:hypothetical protein